MILSPVPPVIAGDRITWPKTAMIPGVNNGASLVWTVPIELFVDRPIVDHTTYARVRGRPAFSGLTLSTTMV